MATIFDVQRDGNGVPVVPYRLRHHSPDYCDAPCGVAFAGGLSVDPVDPPALNRILANLGGDFDLVPVTSAPPPEVAAPPKPREAVAGVIVDFTSDEPPLQPPPADAPFLPTNYQALRAIADARGIAVDKRWKASRLRAEIQKAASC